MAGACSRLPGLGGLFHRRGGILFAGIRGDGDQVGSLVAGGDRGEQSGGHGGEPAEPYDAAARRAAHLQPAGPAGIPVGGAQHDPGDAAVQFVEVEDQPGQLRGRVSRPGPPAAVEQGGAGVIPLQEQPRPGGRAGLIAASRSVVLSMVYRSWSSSPGARTAFPWLTRTRMSAACASAALGTRISSTPSRAEASVLSASTWLLGSATDRRNTP